MVYNSNSTFYIMAFVDDSIQKKVHIRLNYFGAFITKSQIPKLLEKDSFENKNYLDLIAHVIGLPKENITVQMLNRYAEITKKQSFMNAAPTNDLIFGRILKPLNSARKSYCLEEYESSIALSGVVCEMLAILIYILNPLKLNGKNINNEQEENLYGKKFIDFHHARRVDILYSIGLITKEQYDNFYFVLKTRNKQLHVWEVSNINLKDVAQSTHLISMHLFKQITGLKFKNGLIDFNPLLAHYLIKNTNLTKD